MKLDKVGNPCEWDSGDDLYYFTIRGDDASDVVAVYFWDQMGYEDPVDFFSMWLDREGYGRYFVWFDHELDDDEIDELEESYPGDRLDGRVGERGKYVAVGYSQSMLASEAPPDAHDVAFLRSDRWAGEKVTDRETIRRVEGWGRDACDLDFDEREARRFR